MMNAMSFDERVRVGILGAQIFMQGGRSEWESFETHLDQWCSKPLWQIRYVLDDYYARS